MSVLPDIFIFSMAGSFTHGVPSSQNNVNSPSQIRSTLRGSANKRLGRRINKNNFFMFVVLNEGDKIVA